MPRFTRIGLGLLLLLFAGGGLWWMQSSEAPYPSRHSIDRLADTTSIRWTEEGLAAIESRDPLDALSALGYVHGLNRGWTVALWRQTAQGRLSQWFGTGVFPLDKHARKLGLSHQARAAYEQLPAAEKKRLKAYGRGLNAALQSDRVQQEDSFVLLDVQPAPWQPWHTLVIERLHAWLATSPLPPRPNAPSSINTFRDRDQQLRRWLHLHGWERSVAWAVRDPTPAGSTRTTLFQRHVLGAPASPIVQEVALDRPNAPRVTGATLPGMPVFLTGTKTGQAWTSLLRSNARLDQVPLDSAALTHRYERITPSDGDEQLIRIRHLNDHLVLGRAPTSAPLPDSATAVPPGPDTTRLDRPSTAWVLRWPGLTTATDMPAWLRRAGLSSSHADTTAFQLVDADGLRVSSGGRWSITGTPRVVVEDSAGRYVFAGQSDWVRRQAQSFRVQHRPNRPMDMTDLSASDSSAWAARLLPHLQPALDRFARTHPQFQNVVSYLQNWDHTYDPSSIGATLFDQWMRVYRQDLGHVPTLADSSVYFASYRQQRALLRALDTLQIRFGPDVRQWRWERAVPDRRYFPVWSADSLVNADLQGLSTTQYAPLERSGRGHPSALSGGPSIVDPSSTASSPATWTGWTSAEDRSLVVRRHHYDPTEIFERSRIQRSRPSPIRLSAKNASHLTRLVPGPE